MLSMMLFLRTLKNSRGLNNSRSKQRNTRLLGKHLTYLLPHQEALEPFHLLLECRLFRLLSTFPLHLSWDSPLHQGREYLLHQVWASHLHQWVEFLLLQEECNPHLLKGCHHHLHQASVNLQNHLVVCHLLLVECLPRPLVCQVPQEVLLLFQVLCHQVHQEACHHLQERWCLPQYQ